jgi:hypothetical protein
MPLRIVFVIDRCGGRHRHQRLGGARSNVGGGEGRLRLHLEPKAQPEPEAKKPRQQSAGFTDW